MRGTTRTVPAVAAVAVAVVGLVGSCGDDGAGGSGDGLPQRTGEGTIPLVVDTDLASDDLVALAFLLSSPEVDLRAITVSGTGEVRCPQGLDVVGRLLALTGHEDVPVACGRTTPLAGEHAFPQAWRDAADSAYGLELPPAATPPPEQTAVELLGTSLEPGVTLLTLGPLTNVAEVFRADPELAADLASVVVMGGAVDVPGNVVLEGEASDEPRPAEWNVYADPTAAAEVVDSGAPIVLVGLDATNQVPVTRDFLRLLKANSSTPAADLVEQRTAENLTMMGGQSYFWDPLAAAVVVDPGLVTKADATISVVTDEGPASGQTARDPDGSPVTVAVSAGGAAFQELLVRTLDGLGPDEVLAEPAPPVGQGGIAFDGTACTYDGPAELPTGLMILRFESAAPGWVGAAAHLTGEQTIEEILAQVAADPSGQVTGVDQVTPVPPGGPTEVDLLAGTYAVVCADEQNAVVPAATFVVR